MLSITKGHAAWCFGLTAAVAKGALAMSGTALGPSGTETILLDNSAGAVFTIVLLQQLGLPVPAFPALLIAGSLAGSVASMAPLVAVAMAASVSADSLWYAVGRAFGYRVLAGLCKLSLNPGSCVTSAESLLSRWGVSSLVIAKFVPGLSTVAPPVAGALKLPLPSFLLASLIGAALWAGTAIVAGWLLRDQVRLALDILMTQGRIGVAVLVVIILAWFGWALWRKRRFERSARIPHITPPELAQAIDAGETPLLLDLRIPSTGSAARPVEGAIPARLNDLRRAVRGREPGSLIVTLCSCPRDATAVQAARRLTEMGYTAAYPLRGGYESWRRYVDAMVNR